MLPLVDVSGAVTAAPTGNELGDCGISEAEPTGEVDLGPALVMAGLPGEQAAKATSAIAADSAGIIRTMVFYFPRSGSWGLGGAKGRSGAFPDGCGWPLSAS